MGLYDSGTLVGFNGVNYGWKGDFLGFTIGNVHSSQLGIVRVSDSDRYNDDLSPTFTDKTATVPGLDKTYYFGSDHTQKTFTIKFVFDHLTDKQLRELRRIFSKKEPQDLIFDELPYKVYSVKCSSPPQLSYLCFDEDLERIYKGEGTVNFVAYSPYAKSRFKYLEDYNIKNIPEWGGVKDNKMAWLESSGIISKNSTFNEKIVDHPKDDDNRQTTLLHNPGDTKVYPKIALWFTEDLEENDVFGLRNSLGEGISFIKTSLDGIVIDCEKRLIYSLGKEPDNNDSSKWQCGTTVVYNNLIVSGDFFAIPVCNFKDDFSISGIDDESYFKLYIDYDYLYL